MSLRNLLALGRISRVMPPRCSLCTGDGAGPSQNFVPQKFRPSANFALDEAWTARIDTLARDGLIGSYHWISVLQATFSRSAKISALDFDITAQLADEKDQRLDIIDLLYRLRHTNNACDMLPSTEYAIYRLLIRFEDWDNVFRLLNDPINYGAFMNEHVSCLAIYRLLQSGNIQGAAKISTCAMQQETFDFALLNYLAIFSLCKWVEMPERVMDEKIQPPAPSNDPDQYDDDELKTMKFPFLKNDYFDNHFDLSTADALVRKSLQWFSWNLPKELSESGRNELKSRIEALLASEEPETVQFVIEHGSSAPSIASLTEEVFAPILEEAEAKLLKHQSKLFGEWNERRMALIKIQAERVNLLLRNEEIRRHRAELIEEKKVLFFFDNRAMWEEKAREKDELFEELQLNVKEAQETEKEYAESLFESARRISQGRFTAPTNDADAEAKKDVRKGKYIPKIRHNLPRREVPTIIERRERKAELAKNK